MKRDKENETVKGSLDVGDSGSGEVAEKEVTEAAERTLEATGYGPTKEPGEEKEKQVEEAKKREEQEKHKVESDYDRLLKRVFELQDMTNTPAWQLFWKRLQNLRHQHALEIITEEKTRDMIRHQEAIKLIDSIKKQVVEPTGDLDSFCGAYPLFTPHFRHRATWNDALGTVQIKKVS